MLGHLLQHQSCLPLLLIVVTGSRDGVGCVCTKHSPGQHADRKCSNAVQVLKRSQNLGSRLVDSPNRASKALDSLTAIFAGHSPPDA
jgi:hypothetical protein